MKTGQLNFLSHGFTILEIMVVLLIISMLIGVVAANMDRIVGSSELQTTGVKVDSLKSHLFAYRSLAGSYPTQAQGLLALHQEPKDPKPKMWTQTVGKMEDLNDVWGRPFQYRHPGKRNPSSFDIWSMGPDGISDNDDDIGNW